jgi:DNA adenine methylase
MLVGDLAPVARATRFIYLNKTCFNGLYRVNRAGQFNVPLGRYAHPRIFDEEALRRASRALQSVDMRVADFREVLNWARAGDFIYCDPPYVPASKTANFTSYTAQPFGDAEQQALADLARELDRRGCRVMLSNAWLPATLALYRGFRCVELKAARAINANPARRGQVSELLAINYTPE